MPTEHIEYNLDIKNKAAQIVTACGPCRALIFGGPAKELLRELWLAGIDASAYEFSPPVRESELRLPFSDESFDTVISFNGIELISGDLLQEVLVELRRVTRRSLMLFIDTSCWPVSDSLKKRRYWEASCFDAGFRKHPLYYRSNDYASLEHDGDQLFIPLEKLPQEALAKYPMASLREERDLHMDMLRESGSRSDAHVGRYHFAARFVRPGDAVLDAACGLGYGTYVIRSETQARSYIGIDASEYGIDYARLNFGGEATSFVQGMLPDCLASIPDNSIDHVLCFETLEHVLDPVRVLAEFQRVLTPGGRLTCSVPHDWSDETGADPNPFHFHVYDKARFVGELSQYFDLEHLIAQTADRVKQPGSACVWVKRPRSLSDINIDQTSIEAEWLLAVATKSPLDGRQVPYTEQVFSSDERRQAGNSLAFARDYSNPWLVRALVSIGLRTNNISLRQRWAESVWLDHTAGPVDRGAALCVLAYATLEGDSDELCDRLLDRIDDYLAGVVDVTNPTVLRWRVSLMYVGGLLALSNGRRERACRFLNGVIVAPAAQYSTTLLTKPAEAAYLLGLILVSEGRGAEAHRTWWEAFLQVSASLGKRLTEGYDSRPPAFEIREMSAALSLCGRLVAATAHGAEQHCRPSVFYDECHADSLSQIQSFWRVEDALTNLRQNLLLQQCGLDEISSGKDWLEAQWKEGQDERARLTEVLTSLQAGKDWLETQWNAQAKEILSGEQRLSALSAENVRLSSDLENVRKRTARLKRNVFFRVAKKLGLFSYF